MNILAHIVPTVPPQISGLGDYCHQLWKYWPEPKQEWHILAARLPSDAGEHWPIVHLHPFEMNQKNLVAKLLATHADTLILHYVPHAYQPKGVPLWLPKALATWKRQSGGRLVVIFHELFATAPLWRITGWLAPLAKRILREIVALADGWTTSCQPYFDQLILVGKANPADGRVVRIGPNIEPDGTIVRHAANAEKRVVAFGFPGTRLAAIRAHHDLLARLEKEGKIHSLLLLGGHPGDYHRVQTAARISALNLTSRTTEQFDLPSREVSQQLAGQDLALIATLPELRGKSGSYAACQAHGLRCVFPGETDLSGSLISDTDVAMSWEDIADQIRRLAIGSSARTTVS